MKTELELFADFTNKNGGEWWPLESNENYSLWLCKMKHMVNNHVYYDQPVYELFDSSQKRILATTSMSTAYSQYKKLSNI